MQFYLMHAAKYLNIYTLSLMKIRNQFVQIYVTGRKRRGRDQSRFRSVQMYEHIAHRTQKSTSLHISPYIKF